MEILQGLKAVPKKPWEETVDDYVKRLKAVAAHIITKKFKVDSLCRKLPVPNFYNFNLERTHAASRGESTEIV